MLEKMKNWQAFLLLLGVALAIFWPVLIGGKIIVHTWALPDQYPRLAYIARALANHESVLWTDDFLGGFPIFLGAWGEHVQPLTGFLLKTFDYLAVTHWLIFANFFLGALAMYALARQFPFSRAASILTASVYVFNQWLISYLGLLMFWGNAVPLIPLLFLSIIKVARGKSIFIPLAMAVVIWGWLSVMPDVMLYLTLAGGFLAVFLDFSKPKGQRTARNISLFALVTIVGLALASPRILPIVSFIAESTRVSGVVQKAGILESYESHGYIGANSLITALFPYFSVPFSDYIPLLRGGDRLTLLYFGAFPLFLSFIFFLGFNKFKGDYLIKYFTILFIFVLVILIRYLPLFWLLHQLPVLRHSGGTGKWAPIWFAAVAVLCGAALEKIGQIREQPIFRKFVSFAKYFVAVLLVLLIVFNIGAVLFRGQILNLAGRYFEARLYSQTTGRPLEHYSQLIADTFDILRHNFSFTNFHFLAPLIFLLVSFWILYQYAHHKIGDSKFKDLVVVITLLNFIVVWQGIYKVIPKEVVTDPPSSVEFLQQRTSQAPWRVFRLWGGLRNYVDLGLDVKDLEQKTRLEAAMLDLNYSLLYDIPFIGGHENIMSARQSKVMAFIGSERAPGNQTWVFDPKIPISQKLERFQTPQNRGLLSMMNVRYVLTSFAFDRPWKRVFESKVTEANIPVLVYENPEALPRVYFANNVKFIGSDDQSAFEELLRVKNFKNTTLIECFDPECLYVQSQADPNDELEIQEIKAGYLRLKTKTRYPRWLVYSESNLPTWEAKLTQLLITNNQLLIDRNQKLETSLQLPIYTANYLFQAVYIPPGENEVEFKYPGIWKQTGYSIRNLLR